MKIKKEKKFLFKLVILFYNDADVRWRGWATVCVMKSVILQAHVILTAVIAILLVASPNFYFLFFYFFLMCLCLLLYSQKADPNAKPCRRSYIGDGQCDEVILKTLKTFLTNLI